MDIIVNQIEKEVYKQDDKLPSERELCEIYDVSRMTVRQTLLELEREGYIYKLHGLGSFVSSKTFNQNLDKLYSFTEEMKKIGKTPESKVLLFEMVQPTQKIAERLDIGIDENVFKVTRLRLADKEPLIYETSYLPERYFKGLTKEQLESKPMYDVFRDDYQMNITRAIEKFSVSLLRNEEAKWLKSKLNDPAMLINRQLFSNDRVCEYTTSIAKGDKFVYTVELSE